MCMWSQEEHIESRHRQRFVGEAARRRIAPNGGQDQYRLRLPYFSRRGGGRLRVNDVAGLRHTWESP
jgi:hypothetical protein